MTLFLAAPLAAALALAALLPPLSASIVEGPKDLAKAARKRGEALADVTLADDPYRDKKRLCTDLEAYFDSDPPTAGDAKKAAKLVSKLLKRDSPAAWVWRIEELRGRLLLDVDAKGAAKAFEAALAAYPLERYPSPAKQSYFHHLTIDAALARWSATGIDDAEAMLESIAASDARLAAFFPDRLEARYLSNGMGEPLRALYQRLGDALESRLPAVAREIRARSIPDVRTIGDDPKKLFVVLGADRDVDTTRDLVVVMPGGNGQARDFQNWIEKIATPLLDRYVFAILSAPRWSEEQSKNFVWVTSRFQKKYGAAFPVEEFAREVAAELRRQDSLRIEDALLFAWSSGGPAAYATVLSKDDTFRGAYVLASVFKPNQLGVKHAQGRRFWLEQGTSDSITPIRFAKEAAKVLKKNGAEVNLVEFKGGHGFAMPNPGESLRAALEWLDTRTGG